MKHLEQQSELDVDDTFTHSIQETDKTVSFPADLGDLNTGPKQPVLQFRKLTRFGSQNISFCSKYYSEYDWLEYSISKDLAFCFCCRHFGLGNSCQDTFTEKGFQNWRKTNEKLKLHSTRKYHITSKSKFEGYKNSKLQGSVVSQLSDGYKKQIQENRYYFSQLIEILLYLSGQGMAFRGHSKEENSLNQGNFKEACKLFAKFDQQFSNKYNCSTNESSWLIQNQLLSICAENVRENIILDVQTNGFFALMCDEAGSFKGQQMSICVKYTVGLEVHERFLGFLEVSRGRNADFLATEILKFLPKSELSHLNIIAQSHDGAAVMSGHLGGIHAKIKEKYPTAIFTHCMAHRLNLVVVDMCKYITSARSLFNALESLHFKVKINS
ncbi:hypothetical protein QTP88_010849 [Uroleucon formosanum]